MSSSTKQSANNINNKRKTQVTMSAEEDINKRPRPNDGTYSKSTSLPVTMLAGFLGAGKTTLLKHILETKHESDDFKCAIIVNDMAELNIDKALIDTSAIAQSDKVIAMQNGCVCCSLAEDLKGQIKDLAKLEDFNYMIIEASGVSEPAAIAQLFAPNDDNHHHHHHHNNECEDDTSLSDLAHLDTCVTVVAADQFHSNLETVQKGPDNENWAKLMMEQIEYANVVVLNKTDLVTETQLNEISAQISLLNPTATVVTARNSIIDVSQVVSSNQFDFEQFEKLNTLSQYEQKEMSSCCKASIARGESACCKRARTVTTDLSTVMLSPKSSGKTRHAERFGISSFLYKARRPFHSKRFYKDFVQQYFVIDFEDPEEEEHELDDEEQAADEKKQENEEDDSKAKEEEMQIRQEEAKQKQSSRSEFMGNLLRSKGFIWMAHAHDIIGVVGQAGNMMQTSFDEIWTVLDRRAYSTSTDPHNQAIKQELRKDWVDPWGDRRQELVFIGQNLKHEKIQALLDSCLMTDEEFQMGVDAWKATMGDIFLDMHNPERSGDDVDEDQDEEEVVQC